MEFKFRAVDNQPQKYSYPSSNLSNFSDQPLRATYHSADFRDNVDLMRNPNYLSQAIKRELEKEQIREEIIAREIARRRMLEEEVRRELMLEHQIETQRTSEAGISFQDQRFMQFDPRFQLTNRFSHSSFEEQLTFSGHSTFGIPQLPKLPEYITSNTKPLSEINKDKVLFLAKPDLNLCGAKRKAISSPTLGLSKIPPFDSKKKFKEDWSCAICQVSATSQKTLDQHLKGRKHMVKEGSLRANNARKNSWTALPPKKGGKATTLVETIGASNAEQGAEIFGEPCSKIKDSLAESVDDEVLKQKNQSPKDFENESKLKTVQKAENKNNKYKFWCEICEVGVHSFGVLEAHRLGRKHISLVSKLSKVNAKPATIPITLSMATASYDVSQDKDMFGAEKEVRKLQKSLIQQQN